MNLKHKIMKIFFFRIAVLLLLLLSQTSCKSNYLDSSIEKSSNEVKLKYADSLFEIGKLKESLFIYKSLENSFDLDKDRESIYKMATMYAILKEHGKAFACINKTIEKDSTMWVLEEPDFYNLIDDSRWKTIEDNQIKKVEIKKGVFENKELIKNTYRMYLKDQALFYEIEHFKNRKHYEDLKRKINNENLKELEKIIEEYGWPSVSLVGEELATTTFLIVQHQESLESQKKYLAFMSEALKKNDLKKYQYAYLNDRILIGEGKKQVCGTQLTYDKEKKAIYFDVKSVENVNELDSNRKKYDMEPISEYLKHSNIIWDPNKLKLYPNTVKN
jgi:hypothetical protein